MFCNRCRANNADNASFCQTCGKRLGTTGLDESTLLSSPPAYALTYGSASFGRNAYGLIEPGIPPPPPGAGTPSSGPVHGWGSSPSAAPGREALHFAATNPTREVQWRFAPPPPRRGHAFRLRRC